MPSQIAERGIELQPRDCALMKGLLDSRLMTIQQAAELHFDGRREAAKKRLQKLNHAGLIVQRSRRPQDPAIYLLGKQGYLRLRQEGMLDSSADPGWIKIQKRQRISDLMLRHELAVVDAKASFLSAIARHPNLELIEMSISPDRNSFRVNDPAVGADGLVRFRSLMATPDGFIHVRAREADQSAQEHFFFLEVDRGTESLGRLLQKARHYSQYYRKGSFAAKLGCEREDFKRFPFRVLMAFKSAERLNNVAEKLLNARQPIKSQVWLTTMAELTHDPFGSIWIRPADLKAAVKNTEYGRDGSQIVSGNIDRHNREVTVDKHIGKIKLCVTES